MHVLISYYSQSR